MPTKIVETKILLKAEDQATPNIAKTGRMYNWLFDTIDRGVRRITGRGGAGGGDPYKTSRGSPRSEYAPGGGGGGGGGGPPRPPGLSGRAAEIFGDPSKYKWQPPRRPKDDDEDRHRRTFGQRAASGTGWFMGGAGALMGGATHSLTPVVGGMLSAAGGQIMAGLPFGLGVIPGAAAMYAGALMQGTTMVAQPAIRHYGQFADTYRILGEQRSAEARAMQNLTADEAMRLARPLAKVGAFEGLGVINRMRYSEFSPDMLSQFFQTATQSGAAGAMRKENYENLAKTVSVAFSKTGLPSTEQALETLAGLMQASTQHLANIDDDTTKELAVMSHWMEGSGSALLRGPRGVQTMSTLMNWTARAGDPAKEMFIWHTLSQAKPGMTYPQMRKFREQQGATMAILRAFADMPGEWGDMALAEATGISYTQAEDLRKSFAKYGDSDIVRKKIEEADPSSLDYKAKEKGFVGKADTFTKMSADLEHLRMKFSDEFMPLYFRMETELTTALYNLSKDLDIKEQVEKLVGAITSLKDFLSGKGDDSLVGTMRKREVAWENYRTENPEGLPVLNLLRDMLLSTYSRIRGE